MARIRSVLPGQWTDESFVSCSPLARLLAIGIRNEADDGGVFEWKPLQIKMRLLPVDNCDVGELLAELERAGIIRRYDIGGRHFGAIRNFRKYQRPKKPSLTHPRAEWVDSYVGCSSELQADEEGVNSELQGPDPPSGSEPKPLEADAVPRGLELHAQREEVVSRRLRSESAAAASGVPESRAGARTQEAAAAAVSVNVINRLASAAKLSRSEAEDRLNRWADELAADDVEALIEHAVANPKIRSRGNWLAKMIPECAAALRAGTVPDVLAKARAGRRVPVDAGGNGNGGVPGFGLTVARSRMTIRCNTAADADQRMQLLVTAVGTDRAREVADEAYRLTRDGDGVIAALERAAEQARAA